MDRGIAPRTRRADPMDTDGEATGGDPATLSLEELTKLADAICVSVRLEGGSQPE